ncbi:MAG: NAD-dependent epimerase/dehydratase family protein [bacterium]
MKVLVTGANGFIGSHLVEALLSRGDDVRCLLRPTSDRRWLEGLDYEEAPGALDDEGSLARAVAGVDVVYHCAGATKARKAESLYRVNAEGTANLADACSARPTPPSLVYVSSQAAAGPCGADGGRREADECVPVSHYGQSKLEGERALQKRAADLPFVIIRPSAVYGPRDTDMFLFFKFINKGVEPALGWDNRYLSLCYVGDVVDALLLAGRNKRARSEVYFVAHDEVWDWRGVARAVAAALGVKTRTVRVPKVVLFGAATIAELASTLSGKVATLNRERARVMLEEFWVCDISKARKELGFIPRVGFAEGAKLTTAWYREQGWL